MDAFGMQRTMLAGGILIALGVTGMGSAIRFIPRPVVVGFTNGAIGCVPNTHGFVPTKVNKLG